MEAKNEFDPGWNKLAITDKYVARMYKNTMDSIVAFNHSYEYKSHTEKDGAETFKFTIGNVQDGTIYKISRKGKNEVSPFNTDVNKQFDYLTDIIKCNTEEIDCIRKNVVENGESEYYVYLNLNKAKALQDKILQIINSNDAEGVTKVENYFNDDENKIDEVVLKINVKNNKLTKASCDIKTKYIPIAGEYTDRRITLENNVSIIIDKEIDDAKKYKAPDKPDGTIGIGGLKYIL